MDVSERKKVLGSLSKLMLFFLLKSGEPVFDPRQKQKLIFPAR